MKTDHKKWLLSLSCLCLMLLFPMITTAKETEKPTETQQGQVLLWKYNRTGNKALLPDVSLIGILSGAYFRDDPGTAQWPNPTRTGFNLQATELGIQSVVDPYVRADVFIHFLENAFEVEEAYITTLSLPLNLQIRAGKFRAEFGRENAQHLDELHFVDYSRLRRFFLGEGLNDLGVELSVLLPVGWFSEITFEFMQGRNDVNFDSARKQDFLYVGHLTNTFDLSANTTLQTGLSGAWGNNSVNPGNLTQLYAADLYFRWRPHQRRGFKWSAEYYYRSLEAAASTQKEGGISTQVIYQFARRFESGVRFDAVGFPQENFRQYQVSPMLTFLATEFFRLRGQYNFLHTLGATKKQHEAFLQLIFNMGPHGAHSF